MKSLFLVSTFFIISAYGIALPYQGESIKCDIPCPRYIKPTCGDDGNGNYKYYHNECLLERDACLDNKVVKKTHLSLCVNQLEQDEFKNCFGVCPFIYSPVCASDGATYEVFGNECTLKMENCLSGYKWKVVRSDQCGIESYN